MLLLSLLLLLSLFLLGGILLFYGVGKPSWVWILIGVLLMFPLAEELVFQARLSQVELNPLIRDDLQIVGTYSDDEETVTLLPDKTFTYHHTPRTVSGTWERDGDFMLSLYAAETTLDYRRIRFIEYKGTLHLMDDPEDLDMWNGDLGLPKIR